MNPILDSESIVGTADFNGEHMEVYSEAKCRYDSSRSELLAHLDSFLRHEDPALHKERVKAPWLPEPQDVREAVPVTEAIELAQDIATSWRRKITACIPDPTKF